MSSKKSEKCGATHRQNNENHNWTLFPNGEYYTVELEVYHTMSYFTPKGVARLRAIPHYSVVVRDVEDGRMNDYYSRWGMRTKAEAKRYMAELKRPIITKLKRVKAS